MMLKWFFVLAPRTSLAVLQSIVAALTFANYETEVLNSHLSIPTHTLTVAVKDNCQSTAHASS